MSEKTKIKYVSDVAVEDKDVSVKKPFKISEENQRRFIRLEISSPVSLRNISNKIAIMPDEELYNLEGLILNISMGGVLIETEEKFSEDDFLLMRFTVQDVETVENVLGRVKRIDNCDKYCLAGIEFVQQEELNDRLSMPELEILKDRISNFNNRIQDTLEKFMYKE